MNQLLKTCRRLANSGIILDRYGNNFRPRTPFSSEKLLLSFRRTLASVESSTNVSNIQPGPCLLFSEDENMLRDTVRKFSQSSIAPKVREMDEKGETDKEVISQLFSNGLMGLEVPVEYGGSGLTFTQACIVIEEIARVDPVRQILLSSVTVQGGFFIL